MALSTRVDVVRENIRQSLWFLPSIAVVVAVIAGALLVRADPGGPAEAVPFGVSGSSARSVLEVVAGSVLTVMTLMFSLTIVALQIASDQFSPRLLRTFLRDIGIQVAISVFLATFAYCVAVLPFIHTLEDQAEAVPPQAFAGVVILALASLVALIYFIHHIAQSMRIDTIMRHVARDTLTTIDRVYPDRITGQEWIEPLPEIPSTAEAVPCRGSGFIRSIEQTALLRLATANNVVIAFERTIGDYLVAGVPVGWIWRPGAMAPLSRPDDLIAGINAAVHLGHERSLKHDVAFGLRQLVDIAIKTSSEADPATATDAVAHISVVLARLSERRLTNKLVRDSEHNVRVAIPRRGFTGYLELSARELRHYSLEQTEVPRLLLEMLRTVGRLSRTEPRRTAVLAQIDLVAEDALHQIELAADRELIESAATTARDAVEAGRRQRPSIHRELPELPFA